jgi:hypothetical protein
MRLPSTALALLVVLPARAWAPERHWYAGVHLFDPTLGGHFQGIADGNPFRVDLGRDLALGRDRTQLGAGLEYQGPRFGVELAWDQQRYAGRNVLGQDVLINGQLFKSGSVVTSTLQATNATCDWTVRAVTGDGFWLGLDLGLRATTLKVDAKGVLAIPGTAVEARYRTTLPVPQAGPSLGITALDGRLEGRGQVHLLTWRGATYNHLAFDLRYYPRPWLGVEVFADSERFRVPEGTLDRGLDLTLDRTGTGFGIVARF